MAVVKCQECGGAVSDTAKICPHCGYAFKPVEVTAPQSKTEIGKKKVNIPVGIVMIVIGIIAIVGGIFLIGVVIGVFAIIGGIVFVVTGASKITGTHDCECPYCGHKGTITKSAINFRCPNCRKTSVRKGNYLEAIK